MDTTKWSVWRAEDYILDFEDALAYMNAGFELDDPDLIPVSLGDVSRSKAAGEIAQRAGVDLESLRETLNQDGDPRLLPLLRLLKSLGVRVRLVPVEARSPEESLSA